MTTPAEDVRDAFWTLPDPTRKALSDAMTDDGDPFVADLGRALASRPVLAGLLIDAALSRLRFDADALALADSLGDGKPWSVVADAIRRTVVGTDRHAAIAPDVVTP